MRLKFVLKSHLPGRILFQATDLRRSKASKLCTMACLCVLDIIAPTWIGSLPCDGCSSPSMAPWTA